MIKQAAAALAAWCLVAGPAIAFDTGPHANITEQAMALAGYNRPAADAVQVENWLTDYYTSSPTFRGDKCALEKLHFDDVFTDADVQAYWKTLLRNTAGAAAKAKADNDIIEFYVVLGVSLHVVQDFYAHSNWVESSGFGGPGFDTTTYFQWKRNPWRRTDVVHTGWYPNCLNIPQDGHPPHGGYTSGMNHDSVVRPNYNQAYVYGLAASYEWLSQIAQAVADAPGDSTFLSRAMNYQPSGGDAAALARDQDASLYLSEWIQNPLNLASLDGHWNGNHSGYIAAFTAFAAGWVARPDSIFVRSFKDRAVYVGLSQGLYAPFAGPPPPDVVTTELTGAVVDMRTPRVCANFGVGTESYFGQIVATNGGGDGHPAGPPGSPIRDASQYHRPCTDTPWEYLTLVPVWSDSFDMRYSFWNEYGLPSPGQKAVPINGGSTELKFACALRGGPVRCVWGNPGEQMQPLPNSLNVKGSGFQGVALNGIALQVSQGRPVRP